MKSSLQIGSVAGIGIFLHWTFGVLVVGLFAFYLVQGSTVAAALAGVGMMLALFVCVVLHELGHALTARVYGVPTLGITIYPIGGVARLARIPEEAMKEFWIAIAGPAVNLAIAVGLAVVLIATGGALAPQALFGLGHGTLATLLWMNAALFAFNLLPAFPMDGGRVLRALLATRLPYGRATTIAARVGQGMAVLFGIVGLVWFNPVLLFIALFVYGGARQEGQQATLRAALRGVSVRQAMTPGVPAVAPGDALGTAVDELLAGAEHDLPVVEDGAVVGLLARQPLLDALAEQGRAARVAAVATEVGCVLEADAPLGEALWRMQAADCAAAPVTHEGRLVGLLTLEDVGAVITASDEPASAEKPAEHAGE